MIVVMGQMQPKSRLSGLQSVKTGGIKPFVKRRVRTIIGAIGDDKVRMGLRRCPCGAGAAISNL